MNNQKRKTHTSSPTKSNSISVGEIVCFVSFTSGLFLCVLMIDLYRVTIIAWQPLFYTSLVIGASLALITRKLKYSVDVLGSKNLLYPFLYYSVVVGFSLGYFFLALNYYLAYPKITYYSVLIAEKSSMPGPKGHRNEREPLVRFNYFGEEKELVFGYFQTPQVAQANKILVRIKKGRFGFDIVDSKELIK